MSEASTRGTTNRSTAGIPMTSSASTSSRIVRAPRSAHIAEPPTPEIISAQISGDACATITKATTAPPYPSAPSWPAIDPTLSATTTPSGMVTSSDGNVVTEARNHACSSTSRQASRRRRSTRPSAVNVCTVKLSSIPACAKASPTAVRACGAS